MMSTMPPQKNIIVERRSHAEMRWRLCCRLTRGVVRAKSAIVRAPRGLG